MISLKKKIKTTDAVEISLSAALICVCSWIQIPSAIPFTLQIFGVFLCAALLGAKKGFFAVLLYILLGVAGVPVFSGFQGGVGALMSGTGGFIFGFLISAPIVGFSREKFSGKLLPMFISFAVALSVCYIFGVMWFLFIFGGTFKGAFVVCVLPFILPDILKLIFSIVVTNKIARIRSRIKHQ